VLNIFDIAGKQVIHTYYMVTFFYEPVAQVRAEEAGCAGY
jgi:hypothetical protein